MLETIEKTERGLGGGKFNDANGNPCSLQDSSANGSFVWFGVDDVNPKRLINGVWEPVPMPAEPKLVTGISTTQVMSLFNDRMHLNIIDVKKLIRDFESFLTSAKIEEREFTDRKHKKCSIRLSKTNPSAIGLVYDCIELGCDDPEPMVCDGGWHPLVYPEGTVFTTHMFLGVDEIVELLPLMNDFVKNGCL